jgi:hypothetical protein
VRGENVLSMYGTMHRECDLEICYLLGAFDVALDGARAAVRAESPGVAFGDWTRHGMPFYAGGVIWRTDVALPVHEDERVLLEAPAFAGACVRVLVDGAQAGVIAWEPRELDITDFVVGKDSFELGVELVGHRRNAFGPLHHVPTRPAWTGPAEFRTWRDEARWRDDYALVPVGLLTPPRLSLRRKA